MQLWTSRIIGGVKNVRIVRNYTINPCRPHKSKAEGDTVEKFVTHRRVNVIGGSGGNGMLSFLSAYRNEFAGPDGGNGGNGGHVVFRASPNYKSLNHMKNFLVRAGGGQKGRSKNCHGKNADHSFIEVPLGTLVKDKEERLLVSLDKDEDIFIAARGGAGGKGNRFFLSNENRVPILMEEGAEGENRILNLEMRIMAHAGLVGFPNAGKSTFLRAISRARPKVAAYPFTTLNPHIGMVEYNDFEQISVADIPGIIEGAHKNEGLGFSFLRHIERCVCLLFVVDLSKTDPAPHIQLTKLKYELEQYQQGLSQRPHAVIANKVDVPNAEENLQELRQHCDLKIFPVSAKEGINIQPVLLHLRELYDSFGGNTGS